MSSIDRLSGGLFPRRVGDSAGAPSGVVTVSDATHPGPFVTPAGFVAPLPNRAAARARGLNPRSAPRR